VEKEGKASEKMKITSAGESNSALLQALDGDPKSETKFSTLHSMFELGLLSRKLKL
jgi:hypothetical protein